MFEYTPGATGDKFLNDTSFLKLICGPVGGGKSTVALMDLLRRAIRQKAVGGERRTKFIVLRNTAAQLKATVKPLIDSWCVDIPMKLGGAPMGAWRISEGTFDMRFRLEDNTTVRSELVMIAVDTPDDVRRLLSVECSAAWIEECREIDSEVFQGLQGRVARFPSRAAGGVDYPGVIMSTNPPPLGTFWHEFMTEPPENAEVFMQPPAMLPDGSWNPEAENVENLAPDYYENLVAGARPGWISVYVQNQYGAGDFGNPVFKGSYKSDFHVSKEPLHPISQSLNQLIVGMDNGLQAAAVIGQQDARGRVNVLAECYVPEAETMGVESFLDRLLTPLLLSRFPMFRRDNILFVVDPACFQRAQVSEDTIALAIQRRGYKVLRASSNDPEKRIGAVESLLVRQIDGKAGFLIDPSCKYLSNALEWGYRYKKTLSGQGTLTPEKNHFSHLSDAAQYLSLHFSGAITGTGAYLHRPTARKVVRSAYVYA